MISVKNGGVFLMGGFGSGTWTRYDKKRTVSECHVIDIVKLAREGQLHVGKTLEIRFPSGARVSITVDEKRVMHLFYTVNDTQYETLVPLQTTPCNYGGERIWGTCPKCHRRISQLYQPVSRSLYQRRYGLLPRLPFACRECHNLSYKSRQESGERLVFYANRHRRIANQLGARGLQAAPAWTLPIPRPKGMHQKTYERLTEELWEIKWACVQVSRAQNIRVLRFLQAKFPLETP